MYKSPIDIIVSDMYKRFTEQQNGMICDAVAKAKVVVDKDELIKALKYDRDQYDKGFKDAVDSIVHCRDCKHNVANWQHDELDETDYTDIVCDYFMTDGMRPNDFCSCGERKGADK